MAKPEREEDSPTVKALREKAEKEGGVVVDLQAVVKELAHYGITPLPMPMVASLLAHNRKLRMAKDGEVDASTVAYKMALKFVLDTQMLATKKSMETLFSDYMDSQKEGEDEGGDKKDDTPTLH